VRAAPALFPGNLGIFGEQGIGSLQAEPALPGILTGESREAHSGAQITRLNHSQTEIVAVNALRGICPQASKPFVGLDVCLNISGAYKI
jgi:hypothetical protein